MARLVALSSVVAVMLATSAAALGAPPSPQNPAGRDLGVVPVHHQAGKLRRTSNNLSYHNGPAMRTNKTYAIYWFPSGSSYSAGYQGVIDGFLGNVAAASGLNSNVYFSDTQYYDTGGQISSSSSFQGSVVDTNPFPASGCHDSYTSRCLTDAQIQAELKSVMAAHGWTGGPDKMYFVMTPRDVGSCDGNCSYQWWCAYHSWIGSGSSAIMYANQPYANYVPAACGTGQHPNGDDADDTLNVLSHEHNEAITDPQGTAWYDRQGYENGDKCSWNFGTALGSTGPGLYNQAIGAGKYYLQQEWSNARGGCVLTGT